jgi:hypothetical protein
MWLGQLFPNFSGSAQSEQLDLFAPLERRARPTIRQEENNALFNGGRAAGLQALVGLVGPGKPNYAYRALLGICIGWLPLVALTAAQSIAFQDGSFWSFTTDYGVHARSLIAVPLLIGAEAVCLPHLSAVARHFRDAGLIPAHEAPAYRRIMESTLVLLDSMRIEIAVLAFSLTGVLTLRLAVPPDRFPHWHTLAVGAGRASSAAGWWHGMVSVPILVILLSGWMWRLIVWSRFLFLASRLNLRIVAAHPDRAGGMKFVGISAQAFAAVAFPLGVIVAGTVVNDMVHHGQSLASFRDLVLGYVALTVILFVAPLAVFSNRLLAAWRRGAFEYGALARSVGLQMERRWLNHAVESSALDANDFSATTDLYSIASNTYAMTIFPIGWSNLVVLVFSALLPFAPAVLLAISPEVILEKMLGRLL